MSGDIWGYQGMKGDERGCQGVFADVKGWQGISGNVMGCQECPVAHIDTAHYGLRRDTVT